MTTTISTPTHHREHGTIGRFALAAALALLVAVLAAGLVVALDGDDDAAPSRTATPAVSTADVGARTVPLTGDAAERWLVGGPQIAGPASADAAEHRAASERRVDQATCAGPADAAERCLTRG